MVLIENFTLKVLKIVVLIYGFLLYSLEKNTRAVVEENKVMEIIEKFDTFTI